MRLNRTAPARARVILSRSFRPAPTAPWLLEIVLALGNPWGDATDAREAGWHIWQGRALSLALKTEASDPG